MKLENIRIGKRLLGGYVLLIVILILLCVLAFRNMAQTDRRADEITNLNFTKTTLANTVLINLQFIIMELGSAVYTKDKSHFQVVAEKRKIYSAALESLEKMEKDQAGKDLINKFKTTIADGREGSMAMMRAVEAGNFDEAANIYRTVMAPANKKTIDAITELVKYQENGVHAKYRDILSGNKSMRLTLLVFGIIAILASALVSVVLTRSITVPIQKNIDVARTLADGDLTGDIKLNRQDEFGDEMQAFRTLVEKWQKLISEVKMSAASVASASHQLSAGAEQLARGGAAQVERTIQVSTASEEMSQASLDIARNTSDISDSAKEMLTTAEKGSEIVNRSVHEVREIEETVRKSSEFVKDLGDQSEEIGKIINVINEIADQTNLLALNAAIEAARAGEAGRGFAVVADEVKKLAERTSKSTQEIGGMVTSIRTGVDRAVNSMGEVTEKVATGVELSNEAGSSLNEIVRSASNLQSMLQQIAAAIEEMNSTTNEIAKDIEQVAVVTKESSGTAEQVTQAALELSQLSVKLEQSVSEFKV